MQFIDEVKIFIQSGNGGAGCMSFRREANIPKGGPDGGNGGKGGSVIALGTTGLNTLVDYRFQQHFKAKPGGHGMGANRSGAASDDIILKVPVGTEIWSEDETELLGDVTREGVKVVLAKGGDGGFGNAHFKTSTNRAPRKATPGFEGQQMWIRLKLKLLSDAGLVGLPNAGKSTFLSHVSRARPKIADYPFTTLVPQLGVVSVDGKEFVMADLPGLIEGAHEGHGLGDRFLKHVERCGVIVHLIDITSEDPAKSYRIIRKELKNYSKKVFEKQEIIALNKCDALAEDEIQAIKKKFEKSTRKKAHLLSAVSGEGMTPLLRKLYAKIEEFREQQD